jgi:hypothetical protein
VTNDGEKALEPDELRPRTKTVTVKRPVDMGRADRILQDIGKNFRRIDTTKSPKKDGVTAVWHQSKHRTDMLSWERGPQDIERQELCFFGKMVEFRREGGVRTGGIPQSNDDERGPAYPRSDVFQPSREPDSMVLDAASIILRAGKRDYYTQHLLGQINQTLQELDKHPNRTQVKNLEFFREVEAVGTEIEAVSAAKQRTLILGILGASLLTAASVFWYLFTR